MQEPWVELLRELVPHAHVHEYILGNAELGGIVTFQGATRLEIDPVHGKLTCLEYEAYDSMALDQMRLLVAEAIQRWQVGRVVVLHRLGRVYPSEISVMIAVAAGHRGEAFEAGRWLIDTLKRDVPIWKKDVFEDGFSRWAEPELMPRSH